MSRTKWKGPYINSKIWEQLVLKKKELNKKRSLSKINKQHKLLNIRSKEDL